MKMKKFLQYFLCTALLTTLSFSVADAAKKLKVGMECGYAPYNWSQPTAEGGAVKIAGSDEYAYGYDVIIAKKLAESIGAELEIYKIEWDGLPPAVVSGKIDAAIAGMSITNERKQTVDFTKPYYYANIVALVKKNGPFANAKKITDLAGAKASSQINTVWYDKMIDQVPNVKKLPAIDTVPGLIVALQSGKINLFVTDAPTAQAAEFANKDLMMIEFPQGNGFKASAEDIEIGIAVRKGRNDFVANLNKVLEKMTDKDFKAIMAEAIKKQPLAN